jgi:hypothetical protein
MFMKKKKKCKKNFDAFEQKKAKFIHQSGFREIEKMNQRCTMWYTIPVRTSVPRVGVQPSCPITVTLLYV